jgi:uncharacterized membrane protein YkoI
LGEVHLAQVHTAAFILLSLSLAGSNALARDGHRVHAEHSVHHERHSFSESKRITVGETPAKDFPRMSRISFSEAVQKATAEVPGKVVAANLENKNGFLVYAVSITSDGQSKEVIVDAGNGNILEQNSSSF